MVHTVSGIALHRLLRMMNTGDAPYEARAGDRRDGRPGQGVDPPFFDKVGLEPLPDEDVQEGAFPRPRAAAATRSRRVRRAADGALVALRRLVADAEEVVADACGRCSASTPARWPTTRRSTGC